jgi:ribosomal protein S27E
MQPVFQQPDTPNKCEACGSDKIKARVIWLDPLNGQVYPKIKLGELIFFLALMGLSLLWFILAIIYHQNPFWMVVSAVLIATLLTVNVVEVQRYLARKKYEETWFYNCQNCGNQWMAPYEPDSTAPE